MIIFLHGSDAYRLKQAGEDIIGRYKNKYSSGMNLYSIDLSEPTGTDVLESALKSSSFFNEHKLVICKNIFGKKAGSELLAKYLKEYDITTANDITLIAIENTASKEPTLKNKGLLDILNDKKNMIKKIEPLQGEKLYEWIRKETEIRGCSIEPIVVKNLVNMVGTDSWEIINEIDKLSAYGTEKITAADVLSLVSVKTDLNIFDLIGAIGDRNRQKTMELLYKELKSGRDPYYILTMIIYQFRNILTIKDLQKRGLTESEISQKVKLNPFVVKKAVKSPFETAGATNLYNRLLAIDTGFKTGRTDLIDSLYSVALLSY